MQAHQPGAGASSLPEAVTCYLGHCQAGPQGDIQPNAQPTLLTRPQQGVSRSSIRCETCGQTVPILCQSVHVEEGIRWGRLRIVFGIFGLIFGITILRLLPAFFSPDSTTKYSAISALILLLGFFGILFVFLFAFLWLVRRPLGLIRK